MYVGTVHSLCQRLIADRRFFANRQRGRVPAVLDELDQDFHLNNIRRWNALTSDVVADHSAGGQVFKHVIIDEYEDYCSEGLI